MFYVPLRVRRASRQTANMKCSDGDISVLTF
jgi:hypothetical protein